MKKTILTISFASIIAVAPTTTLAQETVEQGVGNRIVQPLERGPINDQLHAETHQAQDNRRRAPANWLDRKGNRIDRKLDWKGDRINDRLDARAHQARDNGRYALAKRLYRKGDRIDRKLDRKGDRINDRLHTKTHRVRGNKRYALAKRLYRKGGQTNDRINTGRNNQGRDWTRSRNNQSEQRFSSFRNTQRFHRSQGHAQSTRRLARR